MTRSAKSASPPPEPEPLQASPGTSGDIGDLADLRLDYRGPPPRGPRGLVVAGLVGATVLGAGLGLWARPAAEERRRAAPAEASALGDRAQRQLQIVVDRSLLPPGMSLEDAPNAGPPEAYQSDPEPEFESPGPPTAPRRSPVGLMKVAAPAVEPAAFEPEPPPEPDRKAAKPAKAEPSKPKPKIEKARVTERKTKDAAKTAKAKPEPKAAKLAKAETKAAKPAKLAVQSGRLEKVAKKISKPVSRTVKAEVAKAKAAKSARRTELAKAEAAKVEKRLAKARVEQARTEKAQTEKARLDRARGQRMAEAKKAATAKRLAEARVKPAPSTLRMTTTVSQVDRCLDRDPGAALVCADPDLGAEDRRMTRAYRNAQAAGVSQADLQRQHRRWLAARAAAAREAPWAVKEVYQARIAELDDLTREAGAAY